MTKQHGGKREGAGRRYLNGSDPHEGNPARRITVTVTQDTLDALEELGAGNVSAGVRKAAEYSKETRKMNVKQIIQKRVTEVYGEPTPNVYKGTDYGGTTQDTGWWYRPFNANPIWLGKSKATALETLQQIEDYREDENDW